MSTKTALVTYDDYQHLPDDGNRYEIIDGELFMTPAPKMYHQDIIGNIYYHIRKFLEKTNLGKVYVSPADVVLSMTDVVEPDLFFISKERSEIITKKNVVAAPDLVVEILSESTAAIDRNRKKDLYGKYGVKEYWIVDPEQAAIEQYILRDGFFELNDELTSSDKLNSKIIEHFSIPLKEVFKS